MAQLATVLSNDYLETARGGPTYRTTIYDGATGFEKRNRVWNTPRHAWTVTFIGLLAEVQSVLDLFDEAMGQGYSFLWTPPGYTEMSFRFDTDSLLVDYIGTSEPGVYVTKVSATLIQVIYA
jgi:phage-related protein